MRQRSAATSSRHGAATTSSLRQDPGYEEPSPANRHGVLDADQVAVVEDGRVVEHGPPRELQAAGGRFAELYDRWLGSVA
jgi:hypothetical protein